MVKRNWKNFNIRPALSQLEARVTPTTYTASNANNSGGGSLRQAVLDANANPGPDVISITTTQTIVLATELLITDAVSIAPGPGITGTAAVSGNLVTRVFRINGAGTFDVTMTRLKIMEGATAGDGGGIFCDGENLLLDGCVIINNSAGNVGGVLVNAPGQLTLTGCQVTSNTSTADNGGVAVTGGASITRSTIANNTAATAGGGLNVRGGLLLDSSTVSGNKAGTNGGGIFVSDGSVGSYVIRNSTISGNSAMDKFGNGAGGGIVLGTNVLVRFDSTLTIQNSTITKNTAGKSGGGGIKLNFGSGVVSIESTVLSGNNNSKGADDDIASTGLVNVKTSAIGSGSGFTLTDLGGNLALGIDLKLGSLTANAGVTNTQLPSKDSPLLNKGSNPAGLAFDQHGVSRQIESAVDIGAVERPAVSFLVTNDTDDGVGSLRRAIQDCNIVGPAIAAVDHLVSFDPTYFNVPRTIDTIGGMDISNHVTIQGPGANLVTVRSKVSYFSFLISPPIDVTMAGLTLDGQGIGGGIFLAALSLQLNDCALVNINNSSQPYGGAITTAVPIDSTIVLLADRCLFANNSGQRGGVIGFTSSGDSQTIILKNCTLTGNTATKEGGAIYAGFKTQVGIQNCTITNNSAALQGGALCAKFGTSSLNLYNSVVTGNVAPNGPDLFWQDISYMQLCAIGSMQGNTYPNANTVYFGNLPIGIDVKLGPLADNGGPTMTRMPALDSPLLNVGGGFSGLDQRGLPRFIGAGVDIGAVEVQPTSVVAIARNDPNPTKAASVSWNVSFADALTGLSASNFTLTGPGAVGANIMGVAGGGKSWTVTANTAAEGALELDLTSNIHLSALPNNLPFQGQTYTVDKLPLTVAIAASATSLNDYSIGAGALALTATFSEPMNTLVAPAFSFPIENPAPTLSFAAGAWLNATTYQATYHVFDLNLSLLDIDVRITGGQDSAGNVFDKFTKADLIDIDMLNPLVLVMSRNDPAQTKLSTVSWSVNFTEPVTGVAASHFLLFNGGLSGSPAITNVSGGGATWTVSATTGSGVGNLSLYMVNTAGVNDAAGNYVAALPVQGPAYAVDHVMPQAAMVTTNTLTVTPANIGPNGFQVTVTYNELMNQLMNPVVSFPVENPAPTLVAAGGAWLDAKTYRADFKVANTTQVLPDIDLHIAGGQDIVGNQQTPLTINDLFDIEMAAPAKITNLVINDNAVQRSRVTSVAVQFDQIIVFTGAPVAAFELKRQSDGQLPMLSAEVDNSGAGTKVSLTFSGTTAVNSQSLADGRYTLFVLANQITGAGLDGNGDGVAGDDYVVVGDLTNKLFRLFGDADGNGSVTAADFNAFRLAYGVGPSIFDFDNDGQTSASDFNQFRLRYGMVI